MPEPYLLLEEPKSYQKADILDFFGIPPAPENALPKNIKAKRQFWGKRANGVGGREQANKIKNWIQKLSKILEDGEFPTSRSSALRMVGSKSLVSRRPLLN